VFVDGKVIDWAEFSDEEIERFIIELEAVRKKRGEEKRRILKEQIDTMVKEQGISLAELFPQAGRNRNPRKEARKRGDQTVKYCNPDNPTQTWSGNGRKPTQTSPTHPGRICGLKPTHPRHYVQTPL
jgi:DNA-binding protein H-NS